MLFDALGEYSCGTGLLGVVRQVAVVGVGSSGTAVSVLLACVCAMSIFDSLLLGLLALRVLSPPSVGPVALVVGPLVSGLVVGVATVP